AIALRAQSFFELATNIMQVRDACIDFGDLLRGAAVKLFGALAMRGQCQELVNLIKRETQPLRPLDAEQEIDRCGWIPTWPRWASDSRREQRAPFVIAESLNVDASSSCELACPQPELVVDHATTVTWYSGTGVKFSSSLSSLDIRRRRRVTTRSG